MSTVCANQRLDLYDLDLHRLVGGTPAFFDNVGITSALGNVYPDAYRVQIGDDQQAYFFGADLTVNDDLQATGGNVLGCQEMVRSGTGWTPRWGIEGLSVPIMGLDAVAQTPGTGDDLAMLARVLAGAEMFRLSPQDDTADGYAGNDTLHGGAGVDRCIVDSSGDRVDESQPLAGGIDTVGAGVDFTLPEAVERLTLTGAAAIDGTGNALANGIEGNAAANRLDGGAGTDTLVGGGNDHLTGGSGRDSFRFTTAPDATSNFDSLADFDAAADRIELDNAVFRALGPAGQLADAAFHAGTSATAADQRILYDIETGRLCCDADGSAALAAVPFAEVVPGTALAADSSWIV